MRLLLILLLSCSLASASCDNALSLCQDLVKTQDIQIVHLKEQVSSLKEQIKNDEPSLLPSWAWMLIGGAAGVVIYSGVKK